MYKETKIYSTRKFLGKDKESANYVMAKVSRHHWRGSSFTKDSDSVSGELTISNGNDTVNFYFSVDEKKKVAVELDKVQDLYRTIGDFLAAMDVAVQENIGPVEKVKNVKRAKKA